MREIGGVWRRRLASALVGAVLAVPGASARAQSVEGNFSLDPFTPGMDRESVIGIEVGSLPLHLAHDAYLWIDYAHNPLVLSRDTGGDRDRLGALVGRRLTTHLGGAISLYDRVQIGLDIPVVLYQGRGGDPLPNQAQIGDLDGFGVGDLRLAPKARLLTAERFGLDLAFLPILTFPTGAPSGGYVGDESVTFAPTLALSRELGPLRIAGNVAWKWRKERQFIDAEIGPQVTFGGGAAIDVEDLLTIPIELAGAIQGSTPASAPFSDSNATPLEIFFRGATNVTPDVQVFAGLAFGLVAGLGTPDFRIFAGVRYAPRPADRDGDRIPDDEDQCPDDPEDRDGFEDQDGCPDPDNDGDLIPDVEDQCPNEPETPDGIDDEDGCPEASRAILTDERIEISDKVHFESGSSKIKKMSYPLLKDVAKLIIANPRVRKVRIEGHTDNVGGAKYNMKLSQDRADSVRKFLIEQGVEEHRLEAAGFGLTRPVATNKTPRGRAANRRVEFMMVDLAGPGEVPAPPAEEPSSAEPAADQPPPDQPDGSGEGEVEFELLDEPGAQDDGSESTGDAKDEDGGDGE